MGNGSNPRAMTNQTSETESGPSPVRKKRGAARRACNNCAQNKLRCDIVQSSSPTCSRCKRLQIECKVEPNFRRIAKRRRTAEMEREIIELRQRLAKSEDRDHQDDETKRHDYLSHEEGSEQYEEAPSPPPISRAQSHPSIIQRQSPTLSKLIQAPRPFGNAVSTSIKDEWSLENVSLSRARVVRLFDHFFRYYHPFLPLLDPSKGPGEYFRYSDLLAWTVICVSSRRHSWEPGLLVSLSGPYSRLLWSTITEVPHNYHVVQALCLLCTWPLPTTSQRTDQTFMLNGLMMQIALQLGLHRPVQPEEFTTVRIEVKGEELKDRIQTWIICNLVSQNVGTGYGQPSGTLYDWAIEPTSLRSADYRIPDELSARLRIEKLCDRVTRSIYGSQPDTANFLNTEKLLIVRLLETELKELGADLAGGVSQINKVHLRAADLHLKLFVFLGANAKNEDLLSLYLATTSFLGQVFELETTPGNLLAYLTTYIFQMIVAAAFALMRLLKSSLSRQIDMDQGRFFFNGAISVIRRISVVDNDRPVRLANVLSQMWNGSNYFPTTADGSLHLKLRTRMSMSHVYDSVWRWRQSKTQKTSDITQGVSTHQNGLPIQSLESQQDSSQDAALILAQLDPNFPFLGDASFSDVFDSLNWVFDGIPDSFGSPALPLE